MNDQQALAVGGDVFGFLAQPDAADIDAGRQPGAKHFVMIAGNVSDLGAAAGMPQNLPQHLVVVFVPIPRFAQTPAVDDVTDQKQILRGGATQEIGEKIAAASPCP